VGANALVGAGTVVLQNIPDSLKVVGVPAKEITYKWQEAFYLGRFECFQMKSWPTNSSTLQTQSYS
jgi:serine acetyltransferase